MPCRTPFIGVVAVDRRAAGTCVCLHTHHIIRALAVLSYVFQLMFTHLLCVPGPVYLMLGIWSPIRACNAFPLRKYCDRGVFLRNGACVGGCLEIR